MTKFVVCLIMCAVNAALSSAFVPFSHLPSVGTIGCSAYSSRAFRGREIGPLAPTYSCRLRMGPSDWESAKDPETGRQYWYNPTTLESRWEAPPEATTAKPLESLPTQSPSPFSPQAAASTFDTMKKFSEKLQEFKSTKDPQEKRKVRLEVLELYTEFAVPALSLAIGTFISFPGAFGAFFFGLQATGRGLPDLLALFSSFPPAVDLLGRVDPNLGNVAIAAVLVELVSPLLFLIAVAIKGGVETWLRGRLPEWGLDVEGLTRRLDAVVGPDDDIF